MICLFFAIGEDSFLVVGLVELGAQLDLGRALRIVGSSAFPDARRSKSPKMQCFGQNSADIGREKAASGHAVFESTILFSLRSKSEVSVRL